MHRAEWYPAAMAASSPLYSELEFFVRSEGGEVRLLHKRRQPTTRPIGVVAVTR